MVQHQTAQQLQTCAAFGERSTPVAHHLGQQEKLNRRGWRMHFNLVAAFTAGLQQVAVQEMKPREGRGEPCGAMPNLRQQIRRRRARAIFTVKRLSQAIGGAHRERGGRFARHNRRRIDSDNGIMAGGIGSPLNDVIRFCEAIELRQSQRAAIPLERGEATRLALSTGFKSEEAQLKVLSPDNGRGFRAGCSPRLGLSNAEKPKCPSVPSRLTTVPPGCGRHVFYKGW
jgi:hypothetical protein